MELSDPIDISSDEKEDVEDLKTKDEEMAEVESFADVELDEPVFHKLASPKKLRKRSSSIRSVQTEEKEESEDEEEAEEEVPQRRKSSRVRRSVLPEKKDDENKTEESSELPPRPRSRQENELKFIKCRSISGLAGRKFSRTERFFPERKNNFVSKTLFENF